MNKTPDDSTRPSAVAPYGSWKSRLSASLLTAQTLRISEPHFDGEDIYWLESRPSEKGRNALVRLTAMGERLDLLPAPLSVRTRANEYGGSPYTVVGGVAYVVLDTDQRIYRISESSGQNVEAQLQPISAEGNYRYADFCLDEQRQRLICVREDHSQNGEPCCEIIALALDGSGKVEVLVAGADFYSNPCLSDDGSQLVWLSWNHPQMPWDGTDCSVAQLTDSGAIESIQHIAGGTTESIFQPQWSPTGDLLFVSDKNNWWNLYCWNGESICCLHEMNAEFAVPQWVFGMSTYGFLDSETLLCCYSQDGQWHLATIDIATQALERIACDLTDISGIRCYAGNGLLLGANPVHGETLYRYDVRTRALNVLAQSSHTPLDNCWYSRPQSVSFAANDPDSDNSEKNAFESNNPEMVHGFYYSPHNPDFTAPPEILPPLIVMCHGGPTAATQASLNLKIQYWTSRGFAVLDVNYRGSTGYGRDYRDRLKNNWGITDVIDVCSGADYLIAQGLVNPQKIAIRGSSAGGYTVLAALTFSDRFTAGASLYGIGNLETLAQDTHKFESRYLDSLVGAYPAEREIYHARSPLNHIEQLNCPVIFLQGLEDKVVPPNQAEAMVDALTQKGIANAYVTFAEEGHGFRQAENIARAIEAELFFYSRVFGFELSDSVTPIDITHMEPFAV